MKGQEKAPINNVNLAVLLNISGENLNIILGKPPRNKKIKIKSFSKRPQKPAMKRQ